MDGHPGLARSRDCVAQCPTSSRFPRSFRAHGGHHVSEMSVERCRCGGATHALHGWPGWPARSDCGAGIAKQAAAVGASLLGQAPRMGKVRMTTRNRAARVTAVVIGLSLGMSCAGAADRAKVLNIYAWSEYFPAALIAKFQTETGIHVNYAVLDSPAAAETILSVGHSNYDIVTMNASPELAREIPKGFWRKLDPASLPNARNADPQIMRLLKSVDPGNQYAVPWMWGTTGLIYNSDKIKAIMPNAPLDSLDMILKKDIAAKFAGCGISMLDSWGDVLPMVSRYIGQPRLSAAKADLDAVMAKLQEVQPYLRRS